MDDSYTTIGRFTPPTCTLEIGKKNSAPSRWAKQTGLKDIKFKLSFDDPRNLDSEPVVIEGDRDELEQLYNIVLSYTENFLEKSFSHQPLLIFSSDKNRVANRDLPYFISQGLVKQELNLEAFIPEDEQHIISLSATQLFDLVDALEEYKKEMTVLAELEVRQQKKSRKFMVRAFGGVSILLALGLIAVGIKIINKDKQPEPIVTNTETNSPIAPPIPKQEVVAPNVPEVAEKPTPKSVENETLRSTETLPPPPAVDTPKTPPDIPDPALYPPVGNLIIPPLPTNRSDKVNQDRQISVESNARNSNTQVESKIVINSETESTLDPNSDSQETDNQLLSQEEVEKNINNQTKESEELLVLEVDSEADEESEYDREIELEDNVNENKITLNNLSEKPSSNESITRVNESRSKIPELPQIQEIKTYFQQKWQSHSELRQTLEYRLIINKYGSIQRIIPIGKAAEIYLDRTNIPLRGESLVSPLTDRDRIVIRLLLSPNGDVRTFLE